MPSWLVHDQSFIMKIAFVTFLGFNVFCCAGFTAASNETELTDKGYAVPEDDLSGNNSEEYFNRTGTNIDLTQSNMNDSEIFEEGQNIKEDYQRSLIFIQNSKSRLPWKAKTRGSFFSEDFRDPNNVFHGAIQNVRGFNFVPQPGKCNYYKENKAPQPSQGYKKHDVQAPIDYPFLNLNKKNERTYGSNNVKTPSALATAINNYYVKKGYRFPVKIEALKPQDNPNTQHDNPKASKNNTVPFPYHLVRHYNPSITATVIIPTVLKEMRKPVENKNDSVHSEPIHDNILNCYSRECAIRARNYRVREYNGVLHGSKCICKNIPTYPNKQGQEWRGRRYYTASERANLRPNRANITEETYEQLMKATNKLKRIVDGMEK